MGSGQGALTPHAPPRWKVEAALREDGDGGRGTNPVSVTAQSLETEGCQGGQGVAG